MTFWDDPQMVINHIRHSCVTSDDTGMCEMVIVKDEADIISGKKVRRLVGFASDDSTEYGDYSQSFDIAVSPGLMGRTPKTNRNAGSRKSRQEHHCKTIHWNSKAEKLSEREAEELFQKKELEPNLESKSDPEHVSLLSQLVQDSAHHPINAFVEYSKFNGEGVEDTCQTKGLEIFLAFLPNEDDRSDPLSITVLETATVQEVIGFVLFKYTTEGRRPRIQGDVRSYSLYIAEEDGEVDMDFPALDEKEVISKFGFLHLALVEKNRPNKPVTSSPSNRQSLVVKVHINKNGYSTVKVDKTDVKMKQIFAKLVKKRQLKRSGRDYHLETEDEPGKAIDLEATLESFGTLSFNLVKEGEWKIEDRGESKRDKTVAVQDLMACLKYKAFRVLLIHRVLSRTEVQLGIHGQKIEIDPVAQAKTAKFWPKVKPEPVSLDMETIADSEIVEEKRASFRILYKKSDTDSKHSEFKHYDFEASSPQIADEIVNKINNILNTLNHPVRAEYFDHKEKKKGEKSKRH